MICISISQESRRLALVDMLNAARQCDLLELRLDRFGKAPELGEILAAKPKPIIMSCRRPRDGGHWQGTEEERLAVLRQCIISKADYVEIELDAADAIRKFPPSKRVISYTNLHETPGNIAEIYAEAQTKGPDVIKLVTLARTPEEAWPLLQLLVKPAVPTVVVGLGESGLLLTILGRRIGAPWTYAALEKGMEAYPQQPTVSDLSQIYHYSKIGRATRFIGVTGVGQRDVVTVAALNASLAYLNLEVRCLPVAVGNVRLFRKIMDAVKLAAVVVGAEDRATLAEVATDLDPAARQAKAVDLLLHKGDEWHGHNTAYLAAMAALEETMRKRSGADRPVQGRMVMVVGANQLARSVAATIKQLGGVPIIASRDRTASLQIAQELECRHLPFEALYSTSHDVLIVCAEEAQPTPSRGKVAEKGVHSGYLKPSMTVMDLTCPLLKSSLIADAELRGCAVVSPRQLFLSQLQRQVSLLTSKPVPPELLANAVDENLPQDEE